MMPTQPIQRSSCSGFTILELAVVIVVVTILSNYAFNFAYQALLRAKIAGAIETSKRFESAVLAYNADMGFFPPDVNRGWDPGLAQPLPYNTDTGQDCNVNPGDCPACPWCPSDWIAEVKAHWGGPYIISWPNSTPWGGKYDYNCWITSMVRTGGCIVLPGIYIGIQGDYTNRHTIPADAEQWLIDKQLDKDGCLNGESQLPVGPPP
jgi:prepilin-type N-terminal cleavage/methylation domain-containing protein